MFEKTKTRAAIALTVAAGAAAAAPVAGARPADFERGAAIHTTAPAPQPATRVVEVRSSGFDWGDAALGAAGMLSLLGVGAGAVVVTRRSRPRLS